MIKVAIIGGSGYTGLELMRLLAKHPAVSLVAVTSREYQGRPISDVFPSLLGVIDAPFMAPDVDELAAEADFFFTAVPHKAAMEAVAALRGFGKRVVDLSADFRFNNAAVYETWYGPHSAQELLAEAVYGLAEIYPEAISRANLVGNPGCYPTSILLPLIPLIQAGAVRTTGIIADSKSGTSGAGRGLSLDVLYCEVNEGFKAYKVASHRHRPEIEQELSQAAGHDVKISFTPHLVPMSRGMLSTIYAQLKGNATTADLIDLLSNHYREKSFVKILKEGSFPNTSHVRGSNSCHIGLKVDESTGLVIIVSVIDNLVKGASGQAIQCMNLMSGLAETTGLDVLAV
ncbi:MAG: N-acetyl-gamma-glutamyl-phosphate reductase [Deltaproteobacteria bacterium]|nr:N-acetyl-gamma-glutamyl-phosphate reductase [Deltaproteobacteria bacterium]